MKKLKKVFSSNRRNTIRLFFRLSVFTLFGIICVFSGQASAQQPAILGTTSASNRAVVFPDANSPGTQNLVPGLPANASPHGVAYFGTDSALISDFSNSRIFVVQVSTATLISTINTTSAGYNGTGTIAVAPNLTAALAMGSTTSLKVIQGPFDSSSNISSVTLSGSIASYQTQAIVFNNAGRAFVYTTAGISVLDAPYNSVAFTIPVSGNSSSGAIAISPDGSTLLTTDLSSSTVKIFQAPFSAASTSTSLTIPGSNGLDGIMVAPNGARAIVVSGFVRQAASIAAPFSSASTVETLPLPTGGGSDGFEDVGISADSQTAILMGNSTTDPAVFIKSPFTAAGAVSSLVPILGVTNSARGNGAVRFLPPGLAPGLTISKSAPATVASGANLTYTINYSNTGTTNVANVIIRDPLPAGTTFVSATNGGTLSGGNVVFNVGTLNAGSGTQSVSFTVTVNTGAGGTVSNNNYTIEGNGLSPVPGPPVTTSVTVGVPMGADLTITDVDTPDTVSPGNVLLYTYLLTNKGPAAANNVTFTTAIPANTTYNLFLQSLDPGFTCTTPAVGGTGSVTCTIASLPVGTVQFKLRVIVNPGTPTDTIITSRADVTLMQTDPTPLDNIATTITRVGAATGGGGTPTGPCLTKMLDYNGDRRADYAVFRPSNNFTYVNPSSETSNLAFTGQPFGDSATDILTPGDYDGDGKTDIAVWRSTNGTFYVLRSSDNTVTAMQYGLPGDEPVARDYDGDCKTDFAVVRRVGDAKIWFIFGSATNTSRGEQFGLANDVVAPGDYDGDGKYDLAVFRGTGDNPATFFVKQSSNNGVTGRQFGLASDLVVPGDYDGDGKTDFAVVRTGTAYQWFILRSSDNTVTGAALGAMPDLPTQADYDGDGKTDISVYRQQIGTFFVRRSLDGVTTQRQFGSNGDLPVASFDTH